MWECETINEKNGRGPGPGKYQTALRIHLMFMAIQGQSTACECSFGHILQHRYRQEDTEMGTEHLMLLLSEKDAVCDGYMNWGYTPSIDYKAHHEIQARKCRTRGPQGSGVMDWKETEGLLELEEETERVGRWKWVLWTHDAWNIMKGWPLLGLRVSIYNCGSQWQGGVEDRKLEQSRSRTREARHVRRILSLHIEVPGLRQEQYCREWCRIWSWSHQELRGSGTGARETDKQGWTAGWDESWSIQGKGREGPKWQGTRGRGVSSFLLTRSMQSRRPE